MIAIRAALKSVARTFVAKKCLDFQRKAFSEKYLFLTNVTISLSLSSLGDILEQQYEIYNGELERCDRQRTVHMGLSGISVGVICHFWYKHLDRHLPGRTIRTVMLKIVLDQLICSPLYISAFFVTTGMLERKSAQEVWTEIKDKAWRLYAAEWAIWPVAQFVNFYWLPTRYRVFYDNVISLGFDVYTSKVKHDDD